MRDPKQRLGGGERDGLDVLEHRFFSSLVASSLMRREISPPFVPLLSSEVDVSNFDPYFTQEPVQLTPPGKTSVFSRDDKEESFANFESVAK